MTDKHGTVKLFTFSFEIDAPNIISRAPKIFSCVPKNLHLVAQVLPNSNLNFEPCDLTHKALSVCFGCYPGLLIVGIHMHDFRS